MNRRGSFMFQEPVTTALKIQHSSIPVAEKRRGDECYAPLLKHPRVSEPHGFIPQIIPYGTFYIIGYNGFKPPFNRGRVKSYCQIIRKYYGDGVKYVRTCIAKTPQVLKEKAIKWHEEESVDGLTTNGVLLNHPQGNFWGGDAKPGCWREVSVNGKLYTLRPIRDSDVRGAPVQHETNLLQDGSLIDLCGATVIWRSADGLKKSITKDNLRQALSEESIFKCTGMCVQYKDSDSSTILSSSGSTDSQKKCLPHVYFKCGHVQTCVDTTRNYAACPVCLEYGPTARLSLGIEAAFYVDRGPLQYAFNPCGHIANKKTVECYLRLPCWRILSSIYAERALGALFVVRARLVLLVMCCLFPGVLSDVRARLGRHPWQLSEACPVSGVPFAVRARQVLLLRFCARATPTSGSRPDFSTCRDLAGKA
ncbi:uncharacterized protein LOC126476502 isoform X9 [Schistocerca serialis cubense]|uniref:uncharacterized protein LOC126476502 isoform X9 n=1 Tax=Schistocerca serialis cubense TaxID=2023355 RepID=UPI00214EB61F|nr:uncharacterized protein LOC126476502 isoform X9 [Schistocerca serialis cubense]